MMAQQRQRLNSMSDHSTPSSELSDETETLDMSDLRLNLETSSDLTDCERQQIESAFSALGTEVRFHKIIK